MNRLRPERDSEVMAAQQDWRTVCRQFAVPARKMRDMGLRWHPPMICDIGTVVELAEKMLAELEALPAI